MRRLLPLPSREAAGRELAAALAPHCEEEGLLILALPRGGVPVAFEIAQALRAELDLMLVRKLGMPGDPELALGAIAAGGFRALNPEVLGWAQLDANALSRLEAVEAAELERRAARYRRRRPPPVLTGRTVVLVDDGIATGATMRAAVLAARSQAPGRLLAAAPVVSRHAQEALAAMVDQLVCLATPEPFGAVAQFYLDFPQISDEAVIALLARAWQGHASRVEAEGTVTNDRTARSPLDSAGGQ